MKIRTILLGAVMTAAVMGAPLAAAAEGTETEKAGTEPELQAPEEKLIRNSEGRIVGIDMTDEPVSVYYQDADYGQLISSDQFSEYEELGLTCDDETKTVYFYGMEVFSLTDEYEEGTALQYLTEKWGEDSDYQRIDLYTVRDKNYDLLYFEFYRQLPYDEFLYDFGEEEYGTEHELWEDEGIAADELWETEEESEAEEESGTVIIGGADGPTSIFIAGKSDGGGGPDSAENEISRLYSMKTAKAEDSQAIYNILFELYATGLLPEANVVYSEEMGEEGTYLDIMFDDPLPDTDEIMLKLSGCGNIILALVDELSEVRFTYTADREEKMQYTLYWDKQAADSSLPEGDVKEYGKSPDQFSKLFSDLW